MFFHLLTTPSATPSESPDAHPASIARRLVALIYESVLMLALLFVLSLLLVVVQALIHLTISSLVYKIIFVVVLWAYFVYCWTRTGQTLAMRVWRIRLQSAEGYLLSTGQASLRYALAWMWVLPAALYNFFLHTSLSQGLVSYAINLVVWGGFYAVLPERQFLHDYLTRTKVVDVAPPSLTTS